MRTERAMTNIKMAVIYQLTILFVNFVDRKLFLEILGVDYLGIHSLFINVINMISLVELGIGTAIIYHLYKPLQEQDEKKITGLMRFYRHLYFGVGAVILLLGIGTTALLPFFIKDITISWSVVRVAYLIFVAGAVLTYWTGFPRALLYAHERNYIIQRGDMTAILAGAVLKIVGLIFMPGYIVYVIIHTLSKVVQNGYIYWQMRKLYPYLRTHRKEKLSQEERRSVRKDVKDLFVQKVSFFVVNSTDNLILSRFVGVVTVGFVSNYQIFFAALMNFMTHAVDAMQASLGNMVVTEVDNQSKIKGIYNKMQFVMFWLASVTVICLYGLVEPFVSIWLGPEYIMSRSILVVLSINFMLWVITKPVWQMMSVSGLFKQDKYNAVAEMLINLLLSLILVQRVGVVGVFIGTTISTIVAWLLKTRVLYKYFFKESPVKYIGQTLGYILLIVVELQLVRWMLPYVTIEDPIVSFVFQVVVCGAVPNVINWLLFRKNPYFVEMKGIVLAQIEKVKDIHKYDGILTKGILALMMVMPLHLVVSNPVARMVGESASMALALIAMMYILYQALVAGNVSKSRQRHVWFYLVFAVGAMLYGILTGGQEGLTIVANLLAVSGIGFAMTLMDWSRVGRGVWVVDLGLVAWIGYIFKSIGKYENPEYGGILFGTEFLGNPNTLGILCALFVAIAAMMYALSKGERYLLYMVACIPLIQATDARTPLLALGVAFLCYMAWVITSKCRILHYLLFIVIGAGVGGVTYIYPRLVTLDLGPEMNTWIRELTGKNLFSGRESLWQQAWEMLEQEPWLGYGMNHGIDRTLQETNYIWVNGVHNEYLQLGLWAGGIGVIILIILGGYLWHKLYWKGSDKVARIGGCIFILLMILGTFETMWLGENIVFGTILWGMIGIGISTCKNRKNTYTEIKNNKKSKVLDKGEAK
ncbi:MAG: O-antigen ligase family protein [Cellulosilyticaceae bacterium]